MNGLEFTIRLIEALAWPLAVVTVFILLRNPLAKAISRMKSVRHGDTELAFAEELQEVSEIATQAEVTIYQPQSSFAPELQVLISTNPRAAVVQGWLPLETELRRLLEARGTAWTTPREAVAALRGSDLLRGQEWSVLDYLINMRNIAAHDLESAISSFDATQFLMISKSMAERLSQQR